MNDANPATETDQTSDAAAAGPSAPTTAPGGDTTAPKGHTAVADGAPDASGATDGEGQPASGEQQVRTSDLLPRDEASPSQGPAESPHDQGTVEPPLLSDANSYLSRWQDIQAAFVDQPSSAVKAADSLVAELMQRLAEGFASERDRLEQQWSGGQDADTEELRVALQRYRSFFNRLLKT
jgi:hypothetical protein